eukprot:5201503-Amphidinium_carterae.2
MSGLVPVHTAMYFWSSSHPQCASFLELAIAPLSELLQWPYPAATSCCGRYNLPFPWLAILCAFLGALGFGTWRQKEAHVYRLSPSSSS